MKTKTLIIFSFLFPIFSFAQVNLVPNGSFEDINYCPQGLNDLPATQNWYSPTLGTPDFFHSCNTNDVGVPLSYFGFQYDFTGDAYSGILISYDSIDLNYREYIQIELLTPLITGKSYIVSFFITKADSAPIVLKNIGIALSNSPIGGNYTTPINFTPQILHSQFLADSNWVQVSDTIIADGGEQYLTLGYFNFNNVFDTMSLFYSDLFINQAYYYVDNISVVEDTITNINESINLNQINIFPNPFFNSININLANTIQEVKAEIFNIEGKLVYEQSLNSNLNFLTLEHLNAGTYLLTLNINQKKFRTLLVKSTL